VHVVGIFQNEVDVMSEEQPPYNAGDAQAVAKRQKTAKTRDLQTRAALRRLMSDPEGRALVWDYLTVCGVGHLSFSSDALVMAFNEGKRQIGNMIIADINRVSPELYMKMAIENQLLSADGADSSDVEKRR
jgi:hypothetical protein